MIVLKEILLKPTATSEMSHAQAILLPLLLNKSNKKWIFNFYYIKVSMLFSHYMLIKSLVFLTTEYFFFFFNGILYHILYSQLFIHFLSYGRLSYSLYEDHCILHCRNFQPQILIYNYFKKFIMNSTANDQSTQWAGGFMIITW